LRGRGTRSAQRASQKSQRRERLPFHRTTARGIIPVAVALGSRESIH
jgi:hypothetical protein